MKKQVKVFLILGIVLLVGGPICGTGGTIIGMIKAFSALGDGDVAANPEKLNVSLDISIYNAAAGLGVGLIGLMMTVGALIAHVVGKPRRGKTAGGAISPPLPPPAV